MPSWLQSIFAVAVNRRSSVLWFVMIALPACSSSAPPLREMRTAATSRHAGATHESTRHWWFEGETKSSGGFIRSITLLVFQKDSQLSGSYSCGMGEHSNALCRDLNDRGKITGGTIAGSKLTLLIRLFPDNSNCVYFGTVAASSVYGSYICYQAATVVERGTWQARNVLGAQRRSP
jgi:hypothetical protein